MPSYHNLKGKQCGIYDSPIIELWSEMQNLMCSFKLQELLKQKQNKGLRNPVPYSNDHLISSLQISANHWTFARKILIRHADPALLL